MPTNEESTTTETHTAENIEAKKRNLTAMYYLTLAFTTEAMMGVIFTAQTAEWPSGLAYLVVVALFDKFRPKDTISRVELRMQLAKLSMKATDKPSVIFEKISSIKNKFERTLTNDGTAKAVIDDEEYLAAAMAAAHEKYKAIVTSVQITKGDAMALKDLEKAMNQYYRVLNGSNNEMQKEETQGQEYTMYNADGRGRGRGGRNRGRGRGRGRTGQKGPCFACVCVAFAVAIGPAVVNASVLPCCHCRCHVVDALGWALDTHMRSAFGNCMRSHCSLRCPIFG